MHAIIANIGALWRGHLGKIVIIVLAVHSFLQAIIEDSVLIDIDNALAIATTGGVLVAFAPAAWHALTQVRTSDGEALVAGIFVHFFGSFYSRIANVAARNFGFNIGTSDWVSGYLIFLIIGAILHLNAPNIIDDRVPPRQWRKIGIITAVGLMVGMLFVIFSGGLPIHP